MYVDQDTGNTNGISKENYCILDEEEHFDLKHAIFPYLRELLQVLQVTCRMQESLASRIRIVRFRNFERKRLRIYTFCIPERKFHYLGMGLYTCITFNPYCIFKAKRFNILKLNLNHFRLYTENIESFV